MVHIFHKCDVLHRKNMYFLIAFLFTCLVYGQSEKIRIDILEIYQARLEEHLFPNIDTLVTNEIVLFYAKPSFEREYSIRIIERGDQLYIEGRFLERILWNEVFERYRKQDNKPFSINVSLNSIPISNKFKEKMLDTINNLTSNNKAIDICDKIQFDGISYVFIIFDKNERVSTIETRSPKPGSIENDMANLFTQMANDLESQSFEEVKYSAMLKSF
jgi:hypothetical protein